MTIIFSATFYQISEQQLQRHVFCCRTKHD